MRVSELNAELRTFCTMKPERCEFIEVIDAVCSHAQSPVDSSLTVDGLHLSPWGMNDGGTRLLNMSEQNRPTGGNIVEHLARLDGTSFWHLPLIGPPWRRSRRG